MTSLKQQMQKLDIGLFATICMKKRQILIMDNSGRFCFLHYKGGQPLCLATNSHVELIRHFCAFYALLISLSCKAHEWSKLYPAFSLQLLKYLIITDNFVKIKQIAVQSKELQDVKGMESSLEPSSNAGRAFDYMYPHVSCQCHTE